MIQRFLSFEIRKDITKKNKKINHAALVRSFNFADRIPFLAKYHKKKLIALGLLLTISWTYDFHKYLFRKILAMRSPAHFVQSWFVEEKKIPGTILQQNYRGVDLKPSSINLLMNIYSTADKELYFGVGRNYLFHVYQSLGVIKTEEEVRKFWQGSGFYKQRNQKAAGVGLVQYLNIFEEGFKHLKKTQQSLTEQQFLNRFVLSFIQKAPEILKWQIEFNKERTKQFLKNMPGDNEKKKDAIIEIIRENTLKNSNLITEEQMEEKIKQMGLKGMNLTDKLLFWELKKTWDVLRMVSIDKKIGHPLTVQVDKIALNREKQQIMERVRGQEQKMKEIQENFQALYQQKIF